MRSARPQVMTAGGSTASGSGKTYAVAAAGGVLGWVAFLSERLVSAALAQLKVSGPLGAREAISEVRVFIASGAALLVLAALFSDSGSTYRKGVAALVIVIAGALA